MKKLSLFYASAYSQVNSTGFADTWKQYVYLKPE